MKLFIAIVATLILAGIGSAGTYQLGRSLVECY